MLSSTTFAEFDAAEDPADTGKTMYFGVNWMVGISAGGEVS